MKHGVLSRSQRNEKPISMQRSPIDNNAGEDFITYGSAFDSSNIGTTNGKALFAVVTPFAVWNFIARAVTKRSLYALALASAIIS